MKRRLFPVFLALLLTLTACGSRQPPEVVQGPSPAAPEAPADSPEAPDVQRPAEAPEAPAPEEPDPSLPEAEEPEIPGSAAPSTPSSAAPMRVAYAAALEDLAQNHLLPSGQDCGFIDGCDISANQFAVYDLDADGREELLILYTSTYTAGMTGAVYDYDRETGLLREQFCQFPLLTFYDNGMVRADWSHNQGAAGDALWPYTLWRWDPETDSYSAVGMVDAWDKSLHEVYDGRDFPDEADLDGDGVVYYLMEYGDYSLESPVDGEQYGQWRDSFLDGAAELELPLLNLTAENIAALKEG